MLDLLDSLLVSHFLKRALSVISEKLPDILSSLGFKELLLDSRDITDFSLLDVLELEEEVANILMEYFALVVADASSLHNLRLLLVRSRLGAYQPFRNS